MRCPNSRRNRDAGFMSKFLYEYCVQTSIFFDVLLTSVGSVSTSKGIGYLYTYIYIILNLSDDVCFDSTFSVGCVFLLVLLPILDRCFYCRFILSFLFFLRLSFAYATILRCLSISIISGTSFGVLQGI